MKKTIMIPSQNIDVYIITLDGTIKDKDIYILKDKHCEDIPKNIKVVIENDFDSFNTTITFMGINNTNIEIVNENSYTTICEYINCHLKSLLYNGYQNNATVYFVDSYISMLFGYFNTIESSNSSLFNIKVNAISLSLNKKSNIIALIAPYIGNLSIDESSTIAKAFFSHDVGFGLDLIPTVELGLLYKDNVYFLNDKSKVNYLTLESYECYDHELTDIITQVQSLVGEFL